MADPDPIKLTLDRLRANVEDKLQNQITAMMQWQSGAWGDFSVNGQLTQTTLEFSAFLQNAQYEVWVAQIEFNDYVAFLLTGEGDDLKHLRGWLRASVQKHT